ncbi:hypothetical protein BGZ51_002702 [Haplosporangium sp. Z 767]|nr:hypothetical protein BGZ50_003451 [Haplosporangium sp. Z 11]KAF9185366.1 hypothetical protein BGZ51_002702 [Haplosporangium sp. Z 767]
MGSKSKSAPSKRAPVLIEQQDSTAPASKRSKKSQDESQSSIASKDMDMDTQEDHAKVENHQEDDEEIEYNDMEMQDDRESSDQESDVEDDEDQELKASAANIQKKAAHTSDRVQKVLTNPEIEAAFHDQYMTHITQAFGDELNTLRETDSLEGQHLELLIDSLNQTGHIYRVMEKELWVAGDVQQ